MKTNVGLTNEESSNGQENHGILEAQPTIFNILTQLKLPALGGHDEITKCPTGE